MNEEDKWLERLGIDETTQVIDTPQVRPDEWLNNLNGLYHLGVFSQRYPLGQFLNTESSIEELEVYLRIMRDMGHVDNYSLDVEQPIEIFDIIGQAPTARRAYRTLTIEYNGGNMMSWDIEQWNPGNVRMMLISWELGFSRERDTQTMRVSG